MADECAVAAPCKPLFIPLFLAVADECAVAPCKPLLSATWGSPNSYLAYLVDTFAICYKHLSSYYYIIKKA